MIYMHAAVTGNKKLQRKDLVINKIVRLILHSFWLRERDTTLIRRGFLLHVENYTS